MTFGGYNELMMTSDITWNDLVESYTYWQLEMSNVTFNGQEIWDESSNEVFIDTGTQTIGAPTANLNNLAPLL